MRPAQGPERASAVLISQGDFCKITFLQDALKLQRSEALYTDIEEQTFSEILSILQILVAALSQPLSLPRLQRQGFLRKN